jgi:hypothetical protein
MKTERAAIILKKEVDSEAEETCAKVEGSGEDLSAVSPGPVKEHRGRTRSISLIYAIRVKIRKKKVAQFISFPTLRFRSRKSRYMFSAAAQIRSVPQKQTRDGSFPSESIFLKPRFRTVLS